MGAAELGILAAAADSSNGDLERVTMKDKICLITGANSGMGKATALGLARMGATVVMVCRDRDRGEIAREEIRDEKRADQQCRRVAYQKIGNSRRDRDILCSELSGAIIANQPAARYTQSQRAVTRGERRRRGQNGQSPGSLVE